MPHKPEKVRTVEITDADDIVRLYGQLGYSIPVGEMRIRIKTLLSDHTTQMYVACTSSNEITGFVYVNLRMSIESGSVAQLMGLVIDQAHRGKGLGRTLVQFAEDWVRSKGVGTVMVNARTKRRGAHSFYQAVGYEKHKEQFRFIKQLR